MYTRSPLIQFEFNYACAIMAAALTSPLMDDDGTVDRTSPQRHCQDRRTPTSHCASCQRLSLARLNLPRAVESSSPTQSNSPEQSNSQLVARCQTNALCLSLISRFLDKFALLCALCGGLPRDLLCAEFPASPAPVGSPPNPSPQRLPKSQIYHIRILPKHYDGTVNTTELARNAKIKASVEKRTSASRTPIAGALNQRTPTGTNTRIPSAFWCLGVLHAWSGQRLSIFPARNQIHNLSLDARRTPTLTSIVLSYFSLYYFIHFY
ncbi:hypothetical protein C8R45DRAFT_438905 [Mycena sanguinolenta]|nr:hypothetical protein C8R45DRAFT_438905 [Mycena sanguinolenta]